jgi:hypothetical protein
MFVITKFARATVAGMKVIGSNVAKTNVIRRIANRLIVLCQTV